MECSDPDQTELYKLKVRHVSFYHFASFLHPPPVYPCPSVPAERLSDWAEKPNPVGRSEQQTTPPSLCTSECRATAQDSEACVSTVVDVGAVQFASASGQKSGKARKCVEQPRKMAVAGRKRCHSAKRVALAYRQVI